MTTQFVESGCVEFPFNNWRMTVTYSTEMEAAPKDETRVLVLVPTGDPDGPISEELSYWDGVGWEGEWRHVEAGWADNDPIAWCALPEIPEEIMDLAMPKAA